MELSTHLKVFGLFVFVNNFSRSLPHASYEWDFNRGATSDHGRCGRQPRRHGTAPGSSSSTINRSQQVLSLRSVAVQQRDEGVLDGPLVLNLVGVNIDLKSSLCKLGYLKNLAH